MMEKIHVLDIHISREELFAMTPEEKEGFYDKVLEAMTPNQRIQMALIGRRVLVDDILQRAEGRSRTALRTMARAVNVTVNEV
jgi:hypothetical protein